MWKLLQWINKAINDALLQTETEMSTMSCCDLRARKEITTPNDVMFRCKYLTVFHVCSGVSNKYFSVFNMCNMFYC